MHRVAHVDTPALALMDAMAHAAGQTARAHWPLRCWMSWRMLEGQFASFDWLLGTLDYHRNEINV